MRLGSSPYADVTGAPDLRFLIVLTVGVDLGGTNIQTVLLDEAGVTRGSSKMRTPMQGDKTLVVDVMQASIAEAVGQAGVDMSEVSGVGIGTPGVVIDGTVGGASNVPDWSERFALGELAEGAIGLPVRVSNDVSAAAVGEHHSGAGVGVAHLLTVFVGTGVGAGLILNGQPYEGSVGGAGEFGHTVVVRGGAVCPCGRRGCVEAYAGRRAMALSAERAVSAGRSTILFDVQEEMERGRLTSGVFKTALDRGDELAADLVDDAIAALGAGIASAVNLLDVDLVILGGGLADKLGSWFRVRLEAAMRPHLFLQPPRVRLDKAHLGGLAGAIGAAVLARDIPGR